MLSNSARNQSAIFAQVAVAGCFTVVSIAVGMSAQAVRQRLFAAHLAHEQAIQEIERTAAYKQAQRENGLTKQFGFQSTDYVWNPAIPPNVGELRTQKGSEPYFDSHGNCVGQVDTQGYIHGTDQPICAIYPVK
jgi:hypothetical protein